jgi:predicted Zn-dependent peptidase
VYQKTRLDNGIRVITEHIPHVRSVTIGFWFKAGSRDEDIDSNGVSHFIEHMVFKGTKSRSARQIAETIDASGGQLNAFTSKEHTCYYARVLDDHMELAVEILSDMVLNSQFSTVELEKEKCVILEEIHSYEDTPDELVHDMFAEAALTGHVLGKGILGSAATISSLTREQLLDYMHTHYTAENLVVAAAGNVLHDQVVATVERYLACLSGRPASVNLNSEVTHSHDVVRFKDSELIHMCIGSHGYNRNCPQQYAIFVLDMAIGGGMSSRLFQELREERGLVYNVYSYHTLFQDVGLLATYTGCSPQNLNSVLDIIRAEFADIEAKGIKPGELHRAKEQLKGSLMLSLESTANRMSRLAKAELFQETLYSPDEMIAKINAVQPDEVQQVARRLLNNNNMVYAAIGPITVEELRH